MCRELVTLMADFADEAATMQLCSMCFSVQGEDPRWRDTSIPRYPAEHTLQIERCVRYLELRGLLERHPERSEWVCIRDTRSTQDAGGIAVELDWPAVIQAATLGKSARRDVADTPAANISYQSMFNAAVSDLAMIAAHLGCDPAEDGGAEPIIDAIDLLHDAALEKAAVLASSHTWQSTPELVGTLMARHIRALKARSL
jgi:hypothetical protein